ncbi:MAG: hypothetical protein K2N28_08745 [Muribaculaceae bacterium]|nr:hypothetical protein [Muribaculaceae bacterium]
MRPTLPLLLFIAAICCLTAPAQRQRTTRTGRLQPAVPTAVTPPACATPGSDTITRHLGRYIHLAGYDKPLTASRETLHAENLTDSLTITSVECEIIYLDSRGRQLHRRTVTLSDPIQPRQTEMLSFPTWDLQRSFYYRLSVRPRRQATPYDVKFNILSITCHKNPQP